MEDKSNSSELLGVKVVEGERDLINMATPPLLQRWLRRTSVKLRRLSSESCISGESQVSTVHNYYIRRMGRCMVL